MATHSKIKEVCCWVTGDSESEINSEIYDFVSFYEQVAVEASGDVESIVGIEIDGESCWTALTFTSYWFVCVVFIGNIWEDLEEISCEELEHAMSPCLPFQVRVKYFVIESPSDYIFIEVKTNELLRSSENSE